VTVLDASAIIALLRNEPGAARVEEELLRGAVCSAVNWSEVAQKVRAANDDWNAASALLLSYDLAVEPVTIDDAEVAANLWVSGSGLSLADRLCLALAARLGHTALTCDTAWSGHPQVELLR
jgi:PIN domain nuclease of toxin-antitoxin system